MERRNINTVGTIFNDFLGLYTGEDLLESMS